MTTATIRGIVRGGKVEPLDKLDAEEGTEVSISVPIRQKQGNGTMITFGMFAKPGARLSTWEDFQEAKKIWEPKEPK